MWKWWLAAIAVLILIPVAVAGWRIKEFKAWRAEAISQRENDPDRMIAETPLGAVEYAVIGEGQPILVLHGTPGGYDSAIAGARERRAAGAAAQGMWISVSRPGYLGTPLASGESFAAQADLFAALLDELGVESAVVFGTMGGSYPAFQFALRHPERTRGLILMAPDVAPLPPGPPPPETMPPGMEMLQWMRARRGEGPQAADENAQAVWDSYLKTTVPYDAHMTGRANDIAQGRDPAIADWPLETISVPTLILHAKDDPRTPYENAEMLADALPDARLVGFEDGGRYVTVTHPEESGAEMEAFLARVAAQAQPGT